MPFALNCSTAPNCGVAPGVRTKKVSFSLCAILVSSLLASCGGGEGKSTPTQVAAKVNSEEITIHEVNSILKRMPPTPPEQTDKIRNEVLDKLVDQHLAAQKAMEKKLDRTPDVVMAIENAKREILAQAYMGQALGSSAKPSDQEAKTYIQEHPELFAERKVFNVKQIAIVGDKFSLPELDQKTETVSFDEVLAWLGQNKEIKVAANESALPAEKIPLELLPALHKLTPGKMLVYKTPQATIVYSLVSSRSEPVGDAMAQDRVKQFLANQKMSKAAEQEIKNLRAQAKIEYLNNFSAVGAKAPVADKPATPSNPNQPSAESIERGMSGLK